MLDLIEYFNNVFEEIVNIHEKLDSAELNEQKELIKNLNEIKTQSEIINNHLLIIHEYIKILDSEYHLLLHDESLDANISIDNSNSKNKYSNNSLQNDKQVYWMADEEAIVTFRKGLGYFELLMYKNSLEYFQKIVESDPSFLMARIYLGLSYMSLGQYKEAMCELSLAYNLLNNDNESTYSTIINHALGCLYAQYEQYDLAEKHYNNVLRLDSNFKNIYFNLGAVFYNQKKYSDAINLFSKGIVNNSSDWEMYYLIGKAYIHKQDFNEAILNLQTAFQLSNKLEIGLLLARIYEILNKYEKSKTIYKSLYLLYPNENELLHRFGWLYFYMNDIKQAIACFKKILSLDPNNLNYIFSLAWTYINIGEFALANNYLDKIIDIDKYSILGYLGQAKILLIKEKYNEAKNKLLTALTYRNCKQELGVITYHLGYYWLKRKQYNKALLCFNTSIKNTPSTLEAYYYIKVLNKVKAYSI